jgi:hypothetical protein
MGDKGDTLKMSNMKILGMQFFSSTQKYWTKVPSNLFNDEIYPTKLKILPFLIGICNKSTLGMSYFKILSILICSWTPKYKQNVQ